MSDILKSEILPTSKSEKKSSVNKTTNEPKKEGNSLFDNILSQSKQLSKSAKEEVKEEKKLPNPNKNINSDTSPKQEVKQETKPTTSLLDRMVNNIQKTTIKDVEQTVSSKAKKTQKIETEITKEDSTTTKSNEKPTNTKLDVKKDIKDTKDVEVKTESKPTGSLLDRMVKDIKSNPTNNTKLEDVKDTKEVEVKSLKKQSIESEPKLVQKNNESLVQKVDTTKAVDDKKVQTEPSNIDRKKVDSKVVDLEADKSVKTQGNSLLDRMVKDIKTNDLKVDKEAVVKPEVKVTEEDTDKSSKQTKLTESENVKTISVEPKVNSGQIENTLKKEVETSQKTQTQTQKTSLMDNLIKESTQIVTTKNIDKDGKVVEQNTITKTSVESEKIDAKEPLQANMFLSNQKTKKDLLSKQKVTEVKENLENEKSGTKGVEKAAKTLELNPSEAVIEKEEVSEEEHGTHTKKQLDQQIKQQNNMLNRVFLKSYTKLEEIHNTQLQQAQTQKSAEVKAIEENTKQVNEEIEMVVDKSVAQSITTRIVESKQKMGSFMSEMARNMYMNYKPPVTAFKINLTPANLGNIAIMMRNNKSENSITVSLNMSQNNTLEVLTDNRSTLQNNLSKLFSEDTQIALEFGMQNDNSNSNFEQAKQEQKNSNTSNRIPTADILGSEENNQESSLYM